MSDCHDSSATPLVLTGTSDVASSLREALPSVAATDLHVLLVGPSGSGRRDVADAIHSLAGHDPSSLKVVNCAVLPTVLVREHLQALVEPPPHQTTTPRALLLIHAEQTAPDLHATVVDLLSEGIPQQQRRTLRLMVSMTPDQAPPRTHGILRLELPSLDERRVDIPALATAILTDRCTNGEDPVPGVAHDALQILMSHRYTRHVRELRDALEYAACRAGGSMITSAHLPPEFAAQHPEANSSDDHLMDPYRIQRAEEPLREAEAQVILMFLHMNGGDRTRTAAALRIHTTTLWRKMKRYGIR